MKDVLSRWFCSRFLAISGWRLSSPSSKCFIHSLVKFRSQTVPKGWAPFNWFTSNFPTKLPWKVLRSSGPQSDFRRFASLWIADSWNIGMNLHFSSGTIYIFIQGPLVHFPSYRHLSSPRSVNLFPPQWSFLFAMIFSEKDLVTKLSWDPRSRPWPKLHPGSLVARLTPPFGWRVSDPQKQKNMCAILIYMFL